MPLFRCGRTTKPVKGVASNTIGKGVAAINFFSQKVFKTSLPTANRQVFKKMNEEYCSCSLFVARSKSCLDVRAGSSHDAAPSPPPPPPPPLSSIGGVCLVRVEPEFQLLH